MPHNQNIIDAINQNNSQSLSALLANLQYSQSIHDLNEHGETYLLLAIRRLVIEDEAHSTQEYPNRGACINILLDHFAGIGFSFTAYKQYFKNIDLTDKILLGASVDKQFIKINPTVTKSIRTVDELEYWLFRNKSGSSAKKAVQIIKLSCTFFLNTCRNNKEMFERISKIIAEMNTRLVYELSTQQHLHAPEINNQPQNQPGSSVAQLFKNFFSQTTPPAAPITPRSASAAGQKSVNFMKR